MDPKNRLLKWYFTTIISLAFFVNMEVALTPDGLALLDFKYNLTATSSLLENWSASDESPCLWGGITCTASGDVQNITLSSQLPKLEGKISPSLGKLKSLQALMLEQNLLSGSIPPQLGNLTSLRTLSLYDNNLLDKFPLELGNCKSLVELWLDANKLTGVIPESLSNLKNLSSMFLGTSFSKLNHRTNKYQIIINDFDDSMLSCDNNLLNGSIEPTIYKKLNLKEFDVGCNNLNGNITAVLEEFSKKPNIEIISMEKNGFKGTLPPSIGNAMSLRWLNLWGQQGGEFGGEIPKEIGKLVNLVFLSLALNNLTGEIPKEIGQLFSLNYLGLPKNNFMGKIPTELGKLKDLKYLYLWANNFVGEIPPELGNLTSLKQLDLSSNNLNGTIPSSLGNLISLNWLNFGSNHLHGTIPTSLGNLVNLKVLSLDNNSLVGSFPTNFASLTNLQRAQFSFNSFTGPFPIYLSRMTSLEIITLWGNQMWGPIPEDFGKYMPNLTTISLADNLFNGTLPNGLCQGGKLQKLGLGNNRFEGAIPLDLAKCTSLVYADFSNNQFTSIPDDFGRNSYLKLLDLSHNHLMGNLPKGLGVNSNLLEVDLSENMLNGEISLLEFPQLARNLSILKLAKNNFTGEIPMTIAMCNLLFEVDLSQNSLTGVVPLALAKLSKLRKLQLQGNYFIKLDPSIYSNWATTLRTLNLAENPWNVPIASEIGSLEILQYLNLSHGRLKGSIPSELGKLTQLEVLDLSHNNLTGEVPSALGILLTSLTSVNISFNHLTGSLPIEWVDRFLYATPTSFQGNPGLCLEYNAITKLCVIKALEQKAKLSMGIIVAITLSVALAIIVIIAIFSSRIRLVLISSFKKHKPRVDDIIVKNLTSTPLPFTFEEIMIATKNLDDAYIIGQGSHGVVYMVVSASSGTSIAVKKIKSLDMTTTIVHKSFWREIETIGNAKHRNLVRLLGFIKWGQVGLLLYDYIPNGNLYSALHNKESRGSDVEYLSWKARLHIAEGVADGLAYLHHDCNPPIIHRDIKSANILLDNDLKAYISDFGLAKVLLVNSTQAHSQQQWASTSNVIGTHGYIAPEVGSGTPISPTLDVYSFGILLLELLTRRQPIDTSYGETSHIIEWVKASALENKSMLSNSIVDPLLLSNANLTIKYEMLTMQRIALLCIRENPGDRPSMRDVAQLLKNVSYEIAMSN